MNSNQSLCSKHSEINNEEIKNENIEIRVAKRGVDKDDDRLFSEEAIFKLQKAREEIEWLLNRDYNINSVIELVGGKYQFSIRQRNALKRSTNQTSKCEERLKKLLPYERIKEGCIHIDGFNLIITLEVALSGGRLILGNDGVLRDIAGLRGTYSVIDKTDTSLELIGKALNEFKVPKIKFFLDAPVSNSGRLKARILNHALQWKFPVKVELVPNADVILAKIDRVVTGDSIILDDCISWFNLSKIIVDNYIKDAKIINLSGK